jgi:hypothetical protein
VSDQEQVIFERYREGILATVHWSHRELTHAKLWRILDAVKVERGRGVPVETLFPTDPNDHAHRPRGFEQAQRLRDQLAAADRELPLERVAELERLAFEGLAEQQPDSPTG